MTDKPGKLLGSGANADVFAYGDNKAVKVYRNSRDKDQADCEFRNSMIVWKAGLPVPQPFGRIETDGLPAIVFERVEGPSMLAGFFRQSDYGCVRELARLAYRIGAVKPPAGGWVGFARVKPMMRWQIAHASNLTQWEKDSALEMEALLPDGESLCHSDLNPSNVFMRQDGPVVIDWQGSAVGNPMYDVMQMVLIWRFAVLPRERLGALWDLAQQKRHEIDRIYLEEYMSLTGATLTDVNAWLAPAAAAKLATTNPCEEEKRLLAQAVREGLGG